MSQRGSISFNGSSSTSKNGSPSGPRSMSIAFNQNASKHGSTAKKGNIFSSKATSSRPLFDDEGPLAKQDTKKPNLLDPPSEPAAPSSSTSSSRLNGLPKKPVVQQASASSPSLAYSVSLRPPPITPAQAPNSASKAASNTASAVAASASTSTSTSEQTQFYKPSPAEAAALARAKQASSSSSSTPAPKDDHVPSKPVQLLKGPKMAISLAKGPAKSGLSAKPNAFQDGPSSSAASSSTSSPKHASTSTSSMPGNPLSSSRGSGKGVASKRSVFGDQDRETSPPHEQASTSKGKQKAVELDRELEVDTEQKKSRASIDDDASTYANGNETAEDALPAASTSALPAEPARIPTPPHPEPEPEAEPLPKTPPKPRKLRQSRWATPPPEPSEVSESAPLETKQKKKEGQDKRKEEAGTPPKQISEEASKPSKENLGKSRPEEPGTPPRPPISISQPISISLSGSTSTTHKQSSQSRFTQQPKRPRTPPRPRKEDEPRTPPSRSRSRNEPGTPPRPRIFDEEPGTPPRPSRSQEPGTPPRKTASPERSLSRPSVPVDSTQTRSHSTSVPAPPPPLPPAQRDTTPPPPPPPNDSRPSTPPAPAPVAASSSISIDASQEPDPTAPAEVAALLPTSTPPIPPISLQQSSKHDEIVRPPPISLKKSTASQPAIQRPPSPMLVDKSTASVERPTSPEEKAFYVTYDPRTWRGPVAKGPEPEIRYEGQGETRPPVDPRKELNMADWTKKLNSSRSSRPLTKVLNIRDYSYDKNSTRPPPVPVPTAIMVSGLAYFATYEKIRSHFGAYGVIAEVDLKIDPSTAGHLGICWIRYLDQVQRKLYGPEGSYIRPAKGFQDGNMVAQEAIRRNHEKKIPTLAKPPDIISVVMDGEGLLTKKAFESRIAKRKALDDQKHGRKPTLAAAAEIGQPATSSSSTPLPASSTPDDTVRQRTISSTSSTIASKSAQQPSSLIPNSTLPLNPSLPARPSTQQSSSNAPRSLSIPLQAKSSAIPTGPRASQPSKLNAFENVPTGPKALMSPTAPTGNRPNPLLTPTGTKFPSTIANLPPSAGPSGGQRGPYMLSTTKTPEKSGNQAAESSSSEDEESDNEEDGDDRRKREDDDKLYFPRSARAGQRILQDTVEALSPVKDSPPRKVTIEAIQDMKAKIHAFTRLAALRQVFVKIVKSSLQSPDSKSVVVAADLKNWMREHRPTNLLEDSTAFYATYRNSDMAATALEALKRLPFRGNMVKMTTEDAPYTSDVQALEADLASMISSQPASRKFDHHSPRKERFEEEEKAARQRPTEAEVIKEASAIIGRELKEAFVADLKASIVPGRITAAWEKQSSFQPRLVNGSASPPKAERPVPAVSFYSQAPVTHAHSTSLALQEATKDMQASSGTIAPLAPGKLPSFGRKKAVPEQKDLPFRRGMHDSYRPASAAPSARERSASTAVQDSGSPERKQITQPTSVDDAQAKARSAEPTPLPPSSKQKEIVKPVKKAEQKPKRTQPKIAFTSSEGSEDDFEATFQLVKKKEAEEKRQRSQKKEAKRRKSVSKVISSPVSAPEDEDEEAEEDEEEREKLDEILPIPIEEPVVVKEITPPAADYESSDLSDLTDLSDLEDEAEVPPPTPALPAETVPEPTTKRELDEVVPEDEQSLQRTSKKPRLASPEPSPLFNDSPFAEAQVEEEFVLPPEIRERSTSKAPISQAEEPEIQGEGPEEEEEEEDSIAPTAQAKNNKKKGKATRRKAASSKSKKKKKAAPAPAPTRSRTASRALSLTPDVQALGLAEDDEDAYYLRLQLERTRAGKIFFPDEVPEEPEPPEGYQKPPPRHDTGCARAEGYYRVPQAEKLSYLAARNQAQVDTAQGGTSSIAVSRLARVNARHLVSGLDKTKKPTASDADVLQFNQLRTRKKQLRFARSPIHDWGLYAQEYIPAGEMVIEYVGEQIRQQVADKREKQYERQGIGSSYLFRVDDDVVIDATMKGNLGRLINHCCTPNCNARILSVGSSKKIVIYAKQPIYEGDEITYDYHFPLEDEKIPCLCGMSGCRGFLN